MAGARPNGKGAASLPWPAPVQLVEGGVGEGRIGEGEGATGAGAVVVGRRWGPPGHRPNWP